jgi:hypothetical protein
MEDDGNSMLNASKRKFKLPTLELKKFGGDVKDRLTFWGQFKKMDEDPGQAFEKRLGRYQIPRWELNTSIQSLCLPFFCPCYHGFISVINIIIISSSSNSSSSGSPPETASTMF